MLANPGTTVLERLPLGRDRPLLAYGGTVLLCAISIGIRLLVAPYLLAGYAYIAFFPTVMLSTFLFGVRPGMLSGLLCGVVAWYCFLPPPFAVKMTASIMFALLFYAGVVAMNITLIHTLQRINQRLVEERERNRQLADRGELLFRELQHRVSNNLQVVSGLLALQMHDITDKTARHALDEAARRLGLIGRIHRQLYSPHGDQLQLSAFVEQLGTDLIDASGRSGIALQVRIDEEVHLPSDAAVPVAVIVAEAIANAIEHGFAGRDQGRISVRAIQTGDILDVTVADNGAGLPAGFALDRSDSLGLRLARMLAQQLGGRFGLRNGEGTTALLRIPLERNAI